MDNVTLDELLITGKFKLDRISRADPTELAELRANVASLKAENQRYVIGASARYHCFPPHRHGIKMP